MKSKMKTTFAIIAVALMVLVAVVPMVSLFTGTSDADATDHYVPEDDQRGTKKIKIVVSVYGSDNKLVTTQPYVRIVWGDAGQFSFEKQLVAAGTETMTIDDTTATNAIVYVLKTVNNVRIVDASYNSASVNGGQKLVSGSTYEVSLKKNFVESENTVTPKISNGTSSFTLAQLFPKATKIEVNYSLYDAATEGNIIKTIDGETSTVTVANNVFKVTYESKATAVYVKINSVIIDGNAVSAVTYTSRTGNLTADSQVPIADQKVLFLETTAYIPNGIVSNVYVAPAIDGGDDDGKVDTDHQVSATILSSSISKTVSSIAVYTLENPVFVKYKVSFGDSISDEIPYPTTTTGNLGAKYTPSGYTGQIGYYNSGYQVMAANGTDLTVKITVTAPGSVTPELKQVAVYVHEGCYYAVKPAGTIAQSAAVEIKSAVGTICRTTSPTTEIAALDSGAIGDLTFKNNDFVKVYGTVDGAPLDFKFKVKGFTAGKIIGPELESKTSTTGTVTTKGNNAYTGQSYEFYVAAGETLTFEAPSGVTFTTASTSSFIVSSTGTQKNIAIVSQSMVFTFKDGDGVAIDMNTTASSNVVVKYLLPGEKTYRTATVAVSGTSKNIVTATVVSGTVDLTKVKVYFENANQKTVSFVQKDKDTAVLYSPSSDSMAITSNDTTYKVYIKDMNGNVITTNLQPKYLTAGARVAEDKTEIFNFDNQTAGTALVSTKVATEGYYTMKVDKSLVDVSLTGTEVDVLIIKVTSDSYIFKGFYKVDSVNGIVTITASADTISGTVTDLNGKKLAGVGVVLYKPETEQDPRVNIDTAVTDSNGAFTVYSDVAKTGSGYKLEFAKEGYEFNPATPYSLTAKTFKSTADFYEVSIVESDGTTEYDPTATDVFKLNGEQKAAKVIGNVFGVTYALEEGAIVSPTLKDGNNDIRTFGKYTVTASDISTGKIKLQATEVLYGVLFTDALEKPIKNIINAGNITIYSKIGGKYTAVTPTYTSWNTVRNAVVYGLPELDSSYDGYFIKVNQPSSSITYGFVTDYIELDEDGTIISSTSIEVVVPVTDYFGNVLKVAPDANNKVPKIGNNNVTLTVDGAMKFLYDTALESVTITWNSCLVGGSTTTYFTTATGTYEYELLDAIIVSDYGLYEVYVTDAFGEAIGAAAANTISLVGFKSLADTGTAIVAKEGTDDLTINANGYGKVIAKGAPYELFRLQVTAEAYNGYTFPMSESLYFSSFETEVEFSYFYANDLPFSTTGATFKTKAFDDDGNVIASSNSNKLVVNVTEVETVASVVTINNVAYSFVGDSDELYCSLSKITGSLPVKAAAGDYVNIELWNEGEVVDGASSGALEANATTYSVIIDVSGSTVTAGAVFDSATATFVHNGSVYAVSTINPASSYNPIVVEPAYALVLIGSDLILEHTDFAVVGNVAYLTADTMFEIVVQTTQVEGKQMVEKYTFAGWYVNGKAVNASEPSISVELTEFANTASAKYTVETYEVVEPTPAPTPAPTPVDNSIDPTVLVIGICAVIVALIAVAYAVISSRPKEKKE